MATLLDALSQENLDNQREVVKNEKRWSYDNRPYGSFQEKLQGHLFPAEHPYHHSTIGSMDDLDAASLEDVSAFFRTYYAPNNAVLSVVGDVDTAHVAGRRRALFRGHPGEPGHPAAGRPVAPADPRRRAPRDGLRPGPAAARPRRLPCAGLRRPAARCARPGRPDPVGREGEPAEPPPGARRADRPGRGDLHARVHRRRLDHRGLGDRPAGRPGRARRGRPPRGARAARHRARQRRRAGARQGADRGRRAGRPAARRGARRPPVDVRDAVRRPGPDQPDAAALPGGHARGDPRRRGGRLPAGQPGRPDLPAGGLDGRRRRASAQTPSDADATTRRWRHERRRSTGAGRAGRRRATAAGRASRLRVPGRPERPAAERPDDPRRRPARPPARLGLVVVAGGAVEEPADGPARPCSPRAP